MSLHRLDEAREEIQRAIEGAAQFGHASEPWKKWAVLSGIEEEAGDAAAAAEARRKAADCYLAYRRDGGENHYSDGRIGGAVAQRLLTGNVAAATSYLKQVAASAGLPQSAVLFLHNLQAVVDGSRDRALADAPQLEHTMAAEILFLIERLEEAERGAAPQ